MFVIRSWNWYHPVQEDSFPITSGSHNNTVQTSLFLCSLFANSSSFTPRRHRKPCWSPTSFLGLYQNNTSSWLSFLFGSAQPRLTHSDAHLIHPPRFMGMPGGGGRGTCVCPGGTGGGGGYPAGGRPIPGGGTWPGGIRGGGGG